MYAPQLTVAIPGKGGPGMQHGHIIRDQDVSLFPREPQTHPAVVQQPVHDLDNLLAVVLDGDVARGELGLGGVPRLMPSHAGRVVDGMPHYQVQIFDFRVPESVVVHGPLGRLEPVDRVRGRQVLEKEARRGEQGESRAFGRRGDGSKVLESVKGGILVMSVWGERHANPGKM